MSLLKARFFVFFSGLIHPLSLVPLVPIIQLFLSIGKQIRECKEKFFLKVILTIYNILHKILTKYNILRIIFTEGYPCIKN